MRKPALLSSEWIVVTCLIFVLLGLTYISHKSWFFEKTTSLENPHYLYKNEITVRIKGAIEEPGLFTVKRGATIADVVKLAKTTPEADLDGLCLEKQVRSNEEIVIRKKGYIIIVLKGAVMYPGKHLVRKGITLEELITSLEWPEEADLSKLRKKKMLKEGDVIKVLTKKAKPSSSILKPEKKID
jgi:hypothetical protein